MERRGSFSSPSKSRDPPTSRHGFAPKGASSGVSDKIVEYYNEATERDFRLVTTSSGRPVIHDTHIEVNDTSVDPPVTLLALDHSDPNTWKRQVRNKLAILMITPLINLTQ